MKRRSPRAGRIAAFTLSLAPATVLAAGDCAALKLKTGATGNIEQRQELPAGDFQPEGAASLPDLPAFCRVVAVLKPAPGSAIRMEVWMPREGWNGKFMGVGNGGFSGSISYAALAEALKRGYATASTNTGHDGASGSFALGQPEKLIDFGYRAVHEMTLAARQLTSDFYARPAARSYWNGCSAGGRQGLQSAQRYPEDYDGIIAGAPAIDWSGRASSALRVAQAVRAAPDAFLDAAALSLLYRGALSSCDASDGLADEVIESPQNCRFDPQVLQCQGEARQGCLSAAQVQAARAIYASPVNPSTGRPITGLFPGSEPVWSTWAGKAPFGTAVDHFRYIVFGDVNWKPEQFRFERDAVRAETLDGNTVNALNPDLSRYFRRGGKLLQYHGWSDPQISPGVSPQYYEAVAQHAGGAQHVSDAYRLFMVPGMAHCSGGNGASSFDMVSVLERWVEQGVAPGEVEAKRLRSGAVDRTRRLCAWPRAARYSGQGDPDSAASFNCVAP